MTDVNRYRVSLHYRPGVLAPTFEAICWAVSEAEAKQKARDLASECGWWDAKVDRVEVREVEA